MSKLRHKSLFNPPGIGCILSTTGRDGGANRQHDVSPYGHNGNGGTHTRLPTGLSAATYDGISQGTSFAIDPFNLETFSFIFWFYEITHVNSDRIAGQVYRGFLDTGYPAYRRYFYWADGTNTGYVNIASLAVGKWYHFGVTCNCDGTDTIVGNYRDGLTTFTTYTGKTLKLTGPNYFSYGHMQGTGQYVNGMIALGKYFTRALSPFDIRQIYEKEKHWFDKL